MRKRYIKITTKDLNDYFKTLSNKGVIRKARVKIFSNMPYLLKAEFKKLHNDLLCTDDVNQYYTIVAPKSSKELQEYLNYFIFKLTKDENSI